ncbi:hypothetical protein [uncultured Tenacibaculum sp.]|uniref:hypothetical protein n=1 Tax=uncultured Tenacibaculum sp. TaxID=174713 RepID=UPI002636030E|nr:hypothetical protein [uncultured Tenacibaculum sp.]
MSKPKGMGNPLVTATAVSAINSEEGQKTIKQGVSALKWGLIILGVVSGGYLLNKEFKKARAKRFSRENAGNPNLTAAAIIYESFTRIGFSPSSFLSYLIPEINISTNETALNDIARQVTNIKAVSHAYYILFDRQLFTDIRKGLDTKELKRFWEIINSPSKNININTLFPIGSELFCAVKTGITVNIAELENNVWKGTGVLYGKFAFREKVGEVVAHGVLTKEDKTQENYYIVESSILGFFKKTGVVLQHQITNEEK